jgi:hypothetical protein
MNNDPICQECGNISDKDIFQTVSFNNNRPINQNIREAFTHPNAIAKAHMDIEARYRKMFLRIMADTMTAFEFENSYQSIIKLCKDRYDRINRNMIIANTINISNIADIITIKNMMESIIIPEQVIQDICYIYNWFHNIDTYISPEDIYKLMFKKSDDRCGKQYILKADTYCIDGKSRDNSLLLYIKQYLDMFSLRMMYNVMHLMVIFNILKLEPTSYISRLPTDLCDYLMEYFARSIIGYL